MGSSRFRKAIGAVKDKTSITLAKVTGNASLSRLRVAIVKATGHKACPAKEHHIREILSVTGYSRQLAAACVRTISRRLGKTKDWVVALKALILLQRLLHEGNPAYQQEVFLATKKGTRLLDMSDFRDVAWGNSWDYSAFVRTYALFLDEQLDYRMKARRGRNEVFSFEDGDEPRRITTPVCEMQNSQIYSRTRRLINLIDRFLACQPIGGAKHNKIVMVALWPIVKQSFHLYYEMTDIMAVLLDRFAELDASDSTKVFEIFCRVAKLYDELDAFYCWCSEAGIARPSDYPEVDKISQKKLDVMDEFIKEKLDSEEFYELEPMNEEANEPESEPEPEQELDTNPIKTLQEVPEGFTEVKKTQDIGDLLDLGEDIASTSTEDHANKLALALFGNGPVAKTETPTWVAFNDSVDWETALVQSASQLSKQQPNLPDGLDTLLLDGLYQQGATQATMANGSASSVALGCSGRLALPAPPSANGDPFAASVAVVPPSFVQMSDMEMKQRLLMEEQMMWQQYYQGQVGLANVHSNQYPCNNMVGYSYRYQY